MRGKAISLSTKIPSLLLVSIWTGGEWINAAESCNRIYHDIFSSNDWKEIPETEYKNEIKTIVQSPNYQMACYRIKSLRDLYNFKKIAGSILRQGKQYYLYTMYSPTLEEFFGTPANVNIKLTEIIMDDVSILLQE